MVWYGDEQTPVGYYNIPYFLELDKVGMAEKYKKSINAVDGKSDFEVMVDQDLYHERKHGKQPTIQIGNHLYYVDFHWGRLRPHIEFEKAVNHWPEDLIFDNLESADNDQAYHFFFDAGKQRVFNFDDNITSVPHNVFLVTIPTEDKLDPYAFARKLGINIEKHLMTHPLRRHFTASLVPAGETFLKDMVAENRQKYKKDDSDQPDNKQQKKKK